MSKTGELMRDASVALSSEGNTALVGGGVDNLRSRRSTGPYTGKPHPAGILQDDRFDATASITVCSFTTIPVEAPLLRVSTHPPEENGLDQPSRLMIDKVTTVTSSSLGERLGRLRDDALIALNRSLIVFFGLASTT